ncbi:MAG TPA: hypothetical protein VF550_20920 [Polyangia bacterium]
MFFCVRIESGGGEVLAAECDGLAGSASIEPGVEPSDVDACAKSEKGENNQTTREICKCRSGCQDESTALATIQIVDLWKQ